MLERRGQRDIAGEKEDTRALGGLKPLTMARESPTHSPLHTPTPYTGEALVKIQEKQSVDPRNQKQDLCRQCPSREEPESN